jgi:hypothetical protein
MSHGADRPEAIQRQKDTPGLSHVFASRFFGEIASPVVDDGSTPTAFLPSADLVSSTRTPVSKLNNPPTLCRA